MKFFDEMHVGFQRERYTNADEPRLLGFMVPNGTTKPDHYDPGCYCSIHEHALIDKDSKKAASAAFFVDTC
jgi:hypothetical protein